MRELALDRLGDDGRHLVVIDLESGDRFQLVVDQQLRDLIDPESRVNTPPAQMETSMESNLSPRDIQARIRRGESPETVAEAAGVPVDRITAFAGPVLAEREFMCEQARKTTIRRKHVGGAGVQLGLLVDQTVTADGGVPESVVWDSWRREDGRWTVLVTPAEADVPATFLFDVKGRYVVPADENAHDLVGDVALPDSTDMAIADAVRAAAVEEPADEAITTQEPEPEPAPIPDPPFLLDRVELSDDFRPEILGAQVSSLKDARDRRALEQMAAEESAAVPEAEIEHPSMQQPAELDDFESTIEHDIAVPDDSGSRTKKRHERRRVPSWDEIMFGGKSD